MVSCPHSTPAGSKSQFITLEGGSSRDGGFFTTYKSCPSTDFIEPKAARYNTKCGDDPENYRKD